MNDIVTPWGRKFYASLVAQACTPAMINYFCRRLANPNLEQHEVEEVGELFDHLINIRPLVTPAHRESGLKYLASRTKLKSTRDEFTANDLLVLSGIPEITWVDTHEEWNGQRSDVRPVFRVAAKGMAFRYWMRPWQSGEHFEIIHHAC